jgi:hypothetical protein
MPMGLLDSLVGRYFRDEAVGRVVVFQGDRRNRGYIVKSDAEESKIRSFLKMFHVADLAITILGGQLAIAWSIFFTHLHSLGNPAEHVLRTTGIYVVIFCLVQGLPFFLFWRSYKKALLSFAPVQNEVLLSGKSAGHRPWNPTAVLTLLGALILLGVIFYLVQAK